MNTKVQDAMAAVDAEIGEMLQGELKPAESRPRVALVESQAKLPEAARPGEPTISDQLYLVLKALAEFRDELGQMEQRMAQVEAGLLAAIESRIKDQLDAILRRL